MAEDVASRVAGAEALPPELRDRVEQAAARLGSIHERWSTAKLAGPAALSERAEAEDAAAPVQGGDFRSEEDALPLDRDAVSVTPILGIETDESDEAGRPRFKTLMGVPRSSPELDELAGLDGSAGSHDLLPSERPLCSPSSERASLRVDEAPSLAGTSLPCEPGAPPSRSPRVSSPWPSLAESPLDVSAEVAALRTASRRRSWWVGLGTIAAAAAVFAIVTPRQRTQALRWVETEYHARLQPREDAISDTARALRPVANATASTSSTTDRETAQLELPVAAPQRAAGELAAVPAGVREMTASVAAAASAVAEDSSAAAARAELANDEVSDHAHASGSASSEQPQNTEFSATPASAGAESTAVKSKPAARDARAGGTTAKARAQVAAPRKPSQRGSNQQSTSATNVAVRATKARATRQNTPRKDGGSGIIRETPF